MYCIVDVETTGLETHDRILEVAAVVWDGRRVLESRSIIIGGLAPPRITEITGIKEGMMRGPLPLQWLNDLDCYFVAHNAPFDRGFLERAGLEKKRWIDTCVDVPYPKHITTRKLTHLCADHGIPTIGAHCALYDCLMVVELLSRYSLAEVTTTAMMPTRILKALTSYSERQLAKDHGFRWDGKAWMKHVKKMEEYPFEVIEL